MYQKLELKPGELIATERFNLEKTMSAFEVMDAKMDIRANAKNAMTPKKALKEKKIKPASELKLDELIGIIDELNPKFVQWIYGASIGQTIYTCLYILDNSLYKDNPVLLAYFTAILHLAYEVQEILRTCSCFREEDYNYSHVLEKIIYDTPMQIEEKFLDAEKYVNSIQDPNSSKLKEPLISRLRLMRGIITVFHRLYGKDSKIEDLPKALNFAEKQIPNILKTLNLANHEVKNCLDLSVIHSFPIVVHVKKIPEISIEESYKKISLFFKHCTKIMDLYNAKELQDIWKLLDEFMKDNPSVLARGLYERSIFPTAEYLYFGKTELSELNIEAIGHYSKSIKTFKTHVVFKDYMEKLSIMTREGIIIHLRNSTRHRKDLEYYFNDLGILLNYAVFFSLFTSIQSTVAIKILEHYLKEKLHMGLVEISIFLNYKILQMYELGNVVEFEIFNAVFEPWI